MNFLYKKCPCKEQKKPCNIVVDYRRNAILTEEARLSFSSYAPDIDPQDIFATAASRFSYNCAHAQRIYDALSKQYFTFSSPMYMNDSAFISCFLHSSGSTMESFIRNLSSTARCLLLKGGMAVDLSHQESYLGGRVSTIRNGKLIDELVSYVSKISSRQPSIQVTLSINHPDVLSFISCRKATGLESDRFHLAHLAVKIDDAFMVRVMHKEMHTMVDPVNGRRVTISARTLFIEILKARKETGEPYIIFTDAVARGRAQALIDLGIDVDMTNLCTEIVLSTVESDNHGNKRGGVCCLASLNLEYYDEYESDQQMFDDIAAALDCVLNLFISSYSNDPDLAHFVYSVQRERALGIGTVGFHTKLQIENLIIGSQEARDLNIRIYRTIRERLDASSVSLGIELGSCEDNAEAGIVGRFTHKIAIAPNAYTSEIMNTSAGINPYYSNHYVYKTNIGFRTKKNKQLVSIIQKKYPTELHKKIWDDIRACSGSIQTLPWFNDREKAVFRVAHEIRQRDLIQLAVDRSSFICQSQALNLFYTHDCDNQEIYDDHIFAWKSGLKTLYYMYSTAKIESNIEKDICIACSA